MRKKNNFILLTVGLIFIILAGYVYIEKFSYINDPLFFFIGWPEELNKPIFKEYIDFSKEGYTKDIKSNIKYPHTYEFEIYDEKGRIAKSYKYQGVVKIELIKNSKVMASVYSKDAYGSVYSSGTEYFQTIVIAKSRVDLRGEVTIRVTVVKADPKIQELGDQIYLTMDGAPIN